MSDPGITDIMTLNAEVTGIDLPQEQVILCVDDEVNILQALKRLLRKEGYTILTANSAEEGLAVLAENPNVQVVISDQRMPGMSGSEFLLQVKNTYPDMLRVILSGYAEPSAIVEAINEGEVCHFLTKPWNEEELKVTIRQCLKHYGLRVENRLLVQKIQEQNQELQYFNSQLSDKVDLQAQSLRFSQEILDKLPMPVIGVSQEGIIALTNEAARTTPSLQAFMMGENAIDMVPQDIAEAINSVLGNETPSTTIKMKWSLPQLEAHVHVIPLETEEESVADIRGCILLFMES